MHSLASPATPAIIDGCTLGAHAGNDAIWRLLRDNIRLIWCEADEPSRLAAIGRLWVRHPLVYDADHAVAGRSAVSAAAARFLARLGSANCVIDATLGGEEGFYMLRWHAECAGVATGLAGCHLAVVTRGRIDSLFTLEDLPDAAPRAQRSALPGPAAR